MKLAPSIYRFIPALVILGLGSMACKKPLPPVKKEAPPPQQEVKPQKRDMDLVIQGSPTMNRDHQGNALSVVVYLYQLKEKEAFNRLTLEMTYSDAFEREILGETLVSKAEYVVLPNDVKGEKFILKPETQYVGAIAFYRNPDKHHWRGIVSVEEPETPIQAPEPVAIQTENPKPKAPIRENPRSRFSDEPKKDPTETPNATPVPKTHTAPPPPKNSPLRIQLHDCYLEFKSPQPETIPGVPQNYKPSCAS